MSTEATVSPAVEGEPTTALTAPAVTTTQTGDPTTTEAKAAEAKPDEAAAKAEGKPEGEKAPEGAPEKYEDFKLPEGMKIIPEVMEKFQALAKERNLSQTDAQKLADIAVEMQQASVANQTEAIKTMRAGWVDAAKTDKEIGGDKQAETLSIAKKAIDAFATPELKKLLNQTGFGDHPELIRAFYRAGKAMSEDVLVASGGATPTKTAHEILYPTMTH